MSIMSEEHLLNWSFILIIPWSFNHIAMKAKMILIIKEIREIINSLELHVERTGLSAISIRMPVIIGIIRLEKLVMFIALLSNLSLT